MSQKSRVSVGMTAERPKVALHDLDHEDDENEGVEGYVKGTDFSLPYLSNWSRLQLNESTVKKRLHRHLNCSYFSTPGDAPTLLALKQHAQALCALIWEISPSLTVSEILGDRVLEQAKTAFKEPEGSAARTLERGQTFDFLANLSTPYWTDDVNHHKPLWALANEVRERSETGGTTYHCPLAEWEPRPVPGVDEHGITEPPQPIKPFASHQNLIMYANACLERLDHEFSAVGGLLGMLPPDAEGEQLAFSKNTLLGQWLRHMQAQQLRMKELEDAYANAITILSGQAHVPMQHLSTLGPDGRRGRELVFPQDRWVLVNSGDDILEYVHDLLDTEEVRRREENRVWLDQGLVGHRLRGLGGVDDDDDDNDAAGLIIPVTLQTRYYRLAGLGRTSPVFVLPAWDHHEATRDQEARPKIVACVQPKYPIRASELEARYNKRIRAADRLEGDNLRLQARQHTLEEQMSSLQAEIDRLQLMQDGLVMHGGDEKAQLAFDLQKEKKAKLEADRLLARAKKAAELAEQEAKASQEKVVEERGETARARLVLDKLREEIAKLDPNDLDAIKKRVVGERDLARVEDSLPEAQRKAFQRAKEKADKEAAKEAEVEVGSAVKNAEHLLSKMGMHPSRH